MAHDHVHIVTIETPAACHEHVRLQTLVWGHEIVHAHVLIAVARTGGVVLGAYAGDLMVGALCGFPALHEGRLAHLSHLLCVHPQWRHHGIGAALKWRQRELVLAQGIDTVIWTYDPLGAANAGLNLMRLGGVVRTYVRDYYGAMDDQLNWGLPSDRFVVTWPLTAARVRERARLDRPIELPVRDASIVLRAELGPHGRPRPLNVLDATGATGAAGALETTQAAALVEIPPTIDEIKRHDPELALAWRLATRAAFERLFAAGYAATGLLRREGHVFYYAERCA